jgi:hypothetical protein
MLDNEEFVGPHNATYALRFAELVGNLSLGLRAVNASLVVDVASDWRGDVVGPEYIPQFAAARGAPRLLDMATYYGPVGGMQFGKPYPRTIKGLGKKLSTLLSLVPSLTQVTTGIGLQSAPGHLNSSCGAWPQCANLTDPACGCCDYGWTQPTLREFLALVEAAGVQELFVWRQDMTPPPGTSASIPQWFIDEMAGFLARA